MSPGNHLFWGQKVKGQGHDVCVGLQTERNITAGSAYVSHAGFQLLYIKPRRTSNASDTGFSLRHFPASACRRVFPGMGFCTLVSAGFYSSFLSICKFCL